MSDLAGVVQAARDHGAITIVDNTFMSPYLQRPLDFGADVVVESATKHLGGHSDLIAGVAAVSDESLGERLHEIQALKGGILSPFDAFQVIKGVRTLGVRLDREQQNALEVAGHLLQHPLVENVRYPGLESDPFYERQRAQADGGGVVVAFELGEGVSVRTFLEALRVITFGASLGGVESLIGQPATSSHRTLPAEVRERNGISDRLIRLSVGIEDVADITADLDQALERARARRAEEL